MTPADSNLRNCLTRLLAVTLLLSAGEGWSHEKPSASELPGIHNFFRVTSNLFSGSQPEGEAGFNSLQMLGVKTVISVDGARPDVAGAAKHGLRYVHLPFGYDGIPTNRVAELAKAAEVLPGPIYVHCHHGKHRGPAAVVVICLANEGWTQLQAEEFLREAGTSPEYPGLFRAVINFVPPTTVELAAVSTNFTSVAHTPSLVDAMVAIDEYYGHLTISQQGRWQTLARPDLAPPHEAALVWEQFRELARSEDAASRPVDFRTKLANAEAAAKALRDAWAGLQLDTTAADAAFKRISQSCADCHRTYRNK